MLINPVVTNLVGVSKRSWDTKPGKVSLAKCTVEFDPENIQFWTKRLNPFRQPPQLLTKRLPSILKTHYEPVNTNYGFYFALTFTEWVEMLPKRKSHTSKKYDY